MAKTAGSFEERLKAKHASAEAEQWALKTAATIRTDAASLGANASAGIDTLSKLLATPRKRSPSKPKGDAAAKPDKK